MRVSSSVCQCATAYRSHIGREVRRNSRNTSGIGPDGVRTSATPPFLHEEEAYPAAPPLVSLLTPFIRFKRYYATTLRSRVGAILCMKDGVRQRLRCCVPRVVPVLLQGSQVLRFRWPPGSALLVHCLRALRCFRSMGLAQALPGGSLQSQDIRDLTLSEFVYTRWRVCQ